jgi:hypothetical protein
MKRLRRAIPVDGNALVISTENSPVGRRGQHGGPGPKKQDDAKFLFFKEIAN